MRPWTVLGVLAAGVVVGRWLLWAYPDAAPQAQAHVGWLLSTLVG